MRLFPPCRSSLLAIVFASLVVPALVVGCGGSGAGPEPSKAGGTFNVRSAIFNTIFPLSNSEYTAIKLLDVDGACDKVTRSQHAPGTSHILLTLVDRIGENTTTRALVKGDYLLNPPASDAVETTNAEFEKRDANCVPDLLSAQSGRVTIERVDASTIAGSYDLSQFGHYVGSDFVTTSDAMKGPFTATICDAFMLTEECL